MLTFAFGHDVVIGTEFTHLKWLDNGKNMGQLFSDIW